MTKRHLIDPEIVRELASIQCTMGEIAAVVRCSVDTLERNFAEIIKSGREVGKESLRRAQWKKAVQEGNPALLIWLGRFYLQQREEMTFNSTEPEVRALLEKWNVVATKKSSFQQRTDKARLEAEEDDA